MSAPLQRTVEETVPAVAAGVDDNSVLAQAPYGGSVTAVAYVPEANITGAATNNRTLSLVNAGQDGNGTTVVASLTFDSGVTADDNNEKALTLGAAEDVVIVEGDTLVWKSVHAGTGLADPGGLARVVVNRA